MPVKMDELEADIQMLFEEKILTATELRQWCDQIEATAAELEKLHSLVSKLLPEKTKGRCAGLSTGGDPNRLLSLLFRIQDTQVNFSGAIIGTKNRTLKILKRLETEQEELANSTTQGTLFLEVA